MFILLLPCILAISSALEAPYYDVDQAEILFEDFIKTYSKVYSDGAEKQMRFEIFKDTLHTINEKNSIGGAAFAVNQFSDFTEEEFKMFMGYTPLESSWDDCEVVKDGDIISNDAPNSIDWVEKGAVTAVKHQGGCGSCYAFSTTGNIEGQYFLKNTKLLSFSEQEIIDCSKSNDGCLGGTMAGAMTDLKKVGGIETETSYPYKGRQLACRFNKSKVVAKIAGCKKYLLNDEDKLKEVLAKRGPISIAVNGPGLFKYHKGIMNKSHCNASSVDHAVLLVGYGTAQDGTAYWRIKNSWGTTWGEEGYARITRGQNTCGLMNDVSVSADLEESL